MKPHTSQNSFVFQYLIAILLLVLALPIQAAVSARLSNPTAYQGQPIRLTLDMEGDQSDTPDLKVLDKDFEILERATQQSISIINGKMSSKRSLVLTLLPKSSGTLTIPPIPFGAQQTAPLTLEVTEQPLDQDTHTQQAWVELSLNKNKAYPEEEIILTLKLIRQAGVHAEHLDDPKPSLSDTRIELLDETQYTTEQNGELYRVLERTYGLFAYQTGRLEIAPVGFRGRTGGRSVFSLLDDPFSQRPRTQRFIQSQSEPVSLEIAPIPAGFTGDQWLPAKHLTLEDAGIDGTSPVVAGKPLTRRIMLIADGLMSSQLPSITQEVPSGIKPYEEHPHLNDTPRKSGISSSRQNVITLIPTEAGIYTLPPIEITWWNTEQDRQEIARLPGVELKVIAAPTTTPFDQQRQNTASTTNEGSPQTPDDENPSNETSLADDGNGVTWVAWLLAAAWLATLVGWWISHRRKDTAQPPVPDEPADKPINQSQSELATIIDRLRRAYEETDAPVARESWLQWGQLQWPDNPPKNLARLAGRCDADLPTAILALEKALYSPGDESGWTDFDPEILLTPQPDMDRHGAETEHLLPLNP
ncbi:MAG: BatD family protein [Candidatus Thiodiazotropha sp. (ex Monitilora ramsayi)]|nr:BatD family protein [Candidatus Thiodiazotropha sp. (ex Monitilora ramsayi)]